MPRPSWVPLELYSQLHDCWQQRSCTAVSGLHRSVTGSRRRPLSPRCNAACLPRSAVGPDSSKGRSTTVASRSMAHDRDAPRSPHAAMRDTHLAWSPRPAFLPPGPSPGNSSNSTSCGDGIASVLRQPSTDEARVDALADKVRLTRWLGESKGCTTDETDDGHGRLTLGPAIPRLTFLSAKNRYFSKQVCHEAFW